MKFNFAKGHPNPGLLPVETTQQILSKLCSTGTLSLQQSLNYLKDDRGDIGLRTELSDYWNTIDNNCSTTTPDDFFMTHGVSHGIDLLCATQTQPGDVVWVERPTYFLVCNIFRDHGLFVQCLPMYEDCFTVNVDFLADLLDRGECLPPRMIYIIPTHQNPTAHTMSLKDRQKLAEIALRHNILVVADEVYHLLDWTATSVISSSTTNNNYKKEQQKQQPSRMYMIHKQVSKQQKYAGFQEDDDEIEQNNSNTSSLTNSGCCVSVSSFTKIFAPGVRCGWIEGPPDIIQGLVEYGVIQSQGACTPFVGEFMRIALHDGHVARTVQLLNMEYQKRCNILCDILSTEPRIRIECRPNGGFFVLIHFPFLANDILQYCRQHAEINFLLGTKCDEFFHDVDDWVGGLPRFVLSKSARLCFADLDLPVLKQGAKLLIKCVREYAMLVNEKENSTQLLQKRPSTILEEKESNNSNSEI